MRRRATAEFAGTGLLLFAIVGSGMAVQDLPTPFARLSMNAIAVGACLAVLIALLAPISGAHLNPAVTLVAWRQRELTGTVARTYIVAQTTGAIGGLVMAHIAFERALISISTTVRTGFGQLVSEVIATFVIVVLIGVLTRTHRRQLIPWTVGVWVAAGIIATPSTAFANPAVTLARSLTDTFAGIAPPSVPAIVLAQFFGALLALVATALLFPVHPTRPALEVRKETLV